MEFSLKNALSEKLKIEPSALRYQPVGGGSINESFLLTVPGEELFCKINNASKFPQMLQKEGKALTHLSHLNVLKVPKVIDHFEYGTQQILILSWINEGPKTSNFWKKFGEQLAALHSISHDSFGWEEDNYMGSIAQHNQWAAEWTEFFTNERLVPLVQHCSVKGLLNKNHHTMFEKVYKELINIFSPEPPALLHGDLWSGNFICNEHEEPVLIDPAIYYGHRSIDLAMTTLFGGFHHSFYEAYHYHNSLPLNYQQQWKVCNLYPLLIHLLLFGNSYRSQVEQILQEFK